MAENRQLIDLLWTVFFRLFILLDRFGLLKCDGKCQQPGAISRETICCSCSIKTRTFVLHITSFSGIGGTRSSPKHVIQYSKLFQREERMFQDHFLLCFFASTSVINRLKSPCFPPPPSPKASDKAKFHVKFEYRKAAFMCHSNINFNVYCSDTTQIYDSKASLQALQCTKLSQKRGDGEWISQFYSFKRFDYSLPSTISARNSCFSISHHSLEFILETCFKALFRWASCCQHLTQFSARKRSLFSSCLHAETFVHLSFRPRRNKFLKFLRSQTHAACHVFG